MGTALGLEPLLDAYAFSFYLRMMNSSSFSFRCLVGKQEDIILGEAIHNLASET